MAAPDINDAFVKQFESEAHIEYQQMGSALRNTVRTKSGVSGSSTTFQVIGNATAGTKSREGDVPVSAVSHAPIEVALADRYSAVYIDKLDELKIQHDERGAQAKNLAAAMGRDTDQIILTALAATSNSTTTATWSAASTPIGHMEAVGNADVPFDGNLYAAISWKCWGDLLDIDEFSNADYVGDSSIWHEGVTAKSWLGIKWFPHSNLQLDGSSNYQQYIYHTSSTGHAIGKDFSSQMDYIPTKDSTLVQASMSHGAGIIDDSSVFEIIYTA